MNMYEKFAWLVVSVIIVVALIEFFSPVSHW